MTGELISSNDNSPKSHFFLDIGFKIVILANKRKFVKLCGDFLDPLIAKLPSSSTRVALVYNIKAEAPPLSSSVGSTTQPLTRESLSSVNDIYAEWDTPETVNAVRTALEERHSVMMIEADEEAFEKLRSMRPDFVFNIAEGLHGPSREAQIPAMLEMLQIPYLGSDPLTLGICLDKARAKEILSYNKIPTPHFTVVRSIEELDDVRVRFPSMVKPLHEGSSKGIYNSSVVRSAEELEREVQAVLSAYAEPALIEEFLPGREFTVALLGNAEDVRVLPIVEIRFDALPPGMNPIYSYEAKWIWDSSDAPLEIFDCPAKLEPSLREEIETLCLDAYRVLGCRDWSRIDVRLDAAGRAHIMEINPLPGILPKPEDNSCFPKAARAAGMSYNQLINTVMDIAMQRCGLLADVHNHHRAALG
ncbi:MAG: D-alanine--D-alanine ligase [Bacteroidetes bacterium]|nr:D-alanine--D-alanine ligase [Bacteroidota bacterium]